MAESPQWIGRICENEGPNFVCGTWYDAHLQSTQPVKQQNHSSGDGAKWEPSCLPKSICWHDTPLPLAGSGIIGPKNVPIRTQLTCNPTISAKVLDHRLSFVDGSCNHFEGSARQCCAGIMPRDVASDATQWSHMPPFILLCIHMNKTI